MTIVRQAALLLLLAGLFWFGFWGGYRTAIEQQQGSTP